MKSTEYHRDNGVKLLVIDTWKNGKLQTRAPSQFEWKIGLPTVNTGGSLNFPS